MAELGTAAIGAGVALGAAAYAGATGFAARHESVHSLQITEIRRHITDFEAAYGRGEVTEEDWEIYLDIRTEARQKESEYEESISAYKETPTFLFVTKWNKKRQVRQKKKALQRANRSLRLHYYESTSDASDTSSVTAVSGSPPRSRKAHSDEDDKRILSWAEDVANSDSDSDGLYAVPGPSSISLHNTRKVATRKHMEADQRHDEDAFRKIPLPDPHWKARMEARAAQQRRNDELRDAYRNLMDTIPLWLTGLNIQEVTKPSLLIRASGYIKHLEKRNKELRARIVREEAEMEHLLNRQKGRHKDILPPGGLDLPVSSSS